MDYNRELCLLWQHMYYNREYSNSHQCFYFIFSASSLKSEFNIQLTGQKHLSGGQVRNVFCKIE